MLNATHRRQVIERFAVLIVTCGLTQSSWAVTILGEPTALSVLLGNPTATIVSGDKSFDGFGYSRVGDMPAAANIQVLPILDDAGDYGIRFQAAFGDQPGGQFSDAYVNYRVTATDPRYVITRATLSGDPSVGTQSVVVIDQSFAGNAGLLEIYASSLAPPPVTQALADVSFSARHTTLNVITDIFANAHATGGPASVSFIDQTYSRLLLGDYDADRDVDGHDLLVWQRQLGATGPTASADGSGNGVVDAADLGIWKSHFGTTPATQVAAVAALLVPEPVGMLLLAVATGVLSFLRHRRRRHS